MTLLTYIFAKTLDDMCSYKTWYYEDNLGYVIECSRCKKLQIGFGNMLVTFEKEAFSSFRKHINIIHERHQPVNNDAVRHIMIPTPCAGLTLFLNTKELYELQNMLELADNEMQADGLLRLFYKQEN